MQRAWNSFLNVQLIWKLIQLLSILGYSQSLEIVGNDFENILQTKKFAISQRTKCETSHIKEERLNQGELIYSENSLSKLKYCMKRAAITVTALKKVFGMTMQHTSTEILNNSSVLTFKKISLPKTMTGTKNSVTGTHRL